MMIDELITVLGFDIKDKGKLQEYESSISKAVTSLKSMATVATVAFGAVVAGLTSINAKTAELSNLSDAVNANFEMVNGLGAIVSGIGLNADNVIDLFEEFNNKAGESKHLMEQWDKETHKAGDKFKTFGSFDDAIMMLDFSSIDKSWTNLNLEQKVRKFHDLSQTAQHNLIFGSAVMMKDSQKAMSAMDILLGGEASKITGYLRDLGLPWDKIVERIEKTNFLTDEGVEGAKRYAGAWSLFNTIFSSIGSQVAGVVGDSVAVVLEWVTTLILNSKEQLNYFFGSLWEVVKAVFTGIFWAFEQIGKGIDFIISKTIGWNNALMVLAGTMAYFFPITAVIMAIGLVIDDVLTYLKGGKSITGEVIGYMKAKWQEFLSFIDSIPQRFAQAFPRANAIIKTIFDTFLSGWEMLKAIGSKISDLGSTFWDNFKGGGDVAIAGGIVGALMEAWKYIVEFGSFVSPYLSKIFDFFGKRALTIFNNVMDGATSIFIGFFNVVGGIFKTITGLFNLDFSQVGIGLATIAIGIGKMLNGVVKAIIGMDFSAFVVKIVGYFKAIKAWIFNIFKSIISFIIHTVFSIGQSFSKIVGVIVGYFNRVKSGIFNIFDNIASFVSSKIDWMLNKINSIKSMASGIFSGDLSLKIKNVAQDVLSAKSAISSVHPTSSVSNRHTNSSNFADNRTTTINVTANSNHSATQIADKIQNLATLGAYNPKKIVPIHRAN